MFDVNKLSARLLCVIMCMCCVKASAQSVQERLNAIIQNADIQELNRLLPQVRDSLDDLTRNVAEGYLHSGMNRPDLAFKCYDNLIKEYSATYEMTDYVCAAVWEQINMGLYKEAKQYMERFYYKDTLQQGVKIPFPDGHPLLDDYNIAYSLQDCAPGKIVRTSDKPTRIERSKMGIGLWMIPGIVNRGRQENFLWDTGCTYNMVSEDFACRHSIRSFADSIEIPGVTEVAFAKIGFIDSITIENMVYQNVLVLILPSIAPVLQSRLGFVIDAILGIPFLKAVGAVELYPQKGRMVFPIVDESVKPNMQSNLSVLDFMRVEIGVGPIKRMLAMLDSGCDCLMMGKSLYDVYSGGFQPYDFKKKDAGIGGLTGGLETTSFWVPEIPVPIKIGGASIKYKDVLVEESTNKRLVPEKLGVGVMNKLKKITINLKAMTVVAH